jgi:hypothetical protein
MRVAMTGAIDYFNSRSMFRGFATHVALLARRRMYEHFVSLAGVHPDQWVLDLGVTPDTSLPDSNFLERWYPYRTQITMASLEDCAMLETLFPGTTFVRIEPDKALPFPDRYFDVGFSSAVLEHVGGATQQLLFMLTLLGQSFWASEANLNLLTRRDLARLVTAALRALGRPARWSIVSHRLLGLSSNLMPWVLAERII